MIVPIKLGWKKLLNTTILLEEVSEHYNTTKGMVISGILGYGKPVEVLCNYTI